MNALIVLLLAAFALILILTAYREGVRQGMKAAHAPDQDTQQGQTAKKHDNKQKLVTLLREHGELSNADLREYLDVSPRTVVNYLDELEQEGKVVQVGDVGQSVVYRLK